MFRRQKILIQFIFVLTYSLFSCTEKQHSVIHSFYYWKTNFQISASERAKLVSAEISKLYVRFFDVNLNSQGQPAPVAKVVMDTVNTSKMEIVPVVFIVNKVLQQLQNDSVESLAEHIHSLIQKTLILYGLKANEIQLDCDWNVGTKNKFFALLSSLRKKMQISKLSCTIRLHQIKYFRKTGVPPVDRGMLMFYNMGDIQDSIHNSIFNIEDASKYVASVKSYPLPLDVALPLFGWYKHYSGNRITGLISEVEDSIIKQNECFSKQGDGNFVSIRDCFFRGSYFHQGDRLVAENISGEELKNAAELLKSNLKQTTFTLSFYHWDNSITDHYEATDLEDLYHLLD